MIKKIFTYLLLGISLCLSATAQAEDYVIDTKGMHAFIGFKVKHLGYSWLLGRFNKFDGTFSYDEKNPEKSKVQINIDVASLDSNHAERDKHLHSKDFFDVDKYPKASFVSTGYINKGNGKGILRGKFTLRGVTKDVAIDVQQIGAGKDPWGGYRRGFMGKTTLHLSDYNMAKANILGPVAENVELALYIEGIRK